MTLARLLDVQLHDTTIRVLEHRRSNLAQFQALDECDEERQHLDAKAVELQAARQSLDEDQSRLEEELAQLRSKRDADSDKLYSGVVTAHKDLQALQAELDNLAERQSGLEDRILAVMGELEPFDGQLGELESSQAGLYARRCEIEASIATEQAEIDREIESESANRKAVAAQIEPALLALYEQAREGAGGVGVARLVNKTCEGCHIRLSAVAYDRIRKQARDAVVHCNCGRLLVRD